MLSEICDMLLEILWCFYNRVYKNKLIASSFITMFHLLHIKEVKCLVLLSGF